MTRAEPPAEARRPGRRRVDQRLNLLLEITQKLMTETDLDSLLLLIAQYTTEMVDADRATIWLVDEDKGELWSKVALGTSEIRTLIGKGLAGTVAQTGEIINIADAWQDPRFNQEIDRRTGYRTKSLITFPMFGHEGGRITGVFQALNKSDGIFTTEDEELLASLAASAAVAIENAQLLAEQKRLWQSLLETLAVTIDARDQQTAGHTQRVSRYTEIIGRQCGLSAKDLEALRAAGLLHDYGKIAVPDGVLMKPGKLDDKEFEYMRAHAQKTAEFLQFITFPRDMRDVPYMAAQHHERMDGKGYPSGITGEDIRFGARIVAAADVFDALTAPRYYKPAYSVEKTLEIMSGMSGEHLDPRVMQAVRDALPELLAALEELKHTWPTPPAEVTGEVSERDRVQPPAPRTPST